MKPAKIPVIIASIIITSIFKPYSRLYSISYFEDNKNNLEQHKVVDGSFSASLRKRQNRAVYVVFENTICKGVFLQRPACIAEPRLMTFIEVGREGVVDTLVIGVEPADFLGQHLFDDDWCEVDGT